MIIQSIVDPFLPEIPIPGRMGYYPCKNQEEWRTLPLPLRCSTWYENVETVIFKTSFSNLGIGAVVEVHPESVFKALFTLNKSGAQLYNLVGVKINGQRYAANWLQDTETGAFAIYGNGGRLIAWQGGFRRHMPDNCVDKGDGAWNLLLRNETRVPFTRFCMV